MLKKFESSKILNFFFFKKLAKHKLNNVTILKNIRLDRKFKKY